MCQHLVIPTPSKRGVRDYDCVFFRDVPTTYNVCVHNLVAFWTVGQSSCYSFAFDPQNGQTDDVWFSFISLTLIPKFSVVMVKWLIMYLNDQKLWIIVLVLDPPSLSLILSYPTNISYHDFRYFLFVTEFNKPVNDRVNCVSEPHLSGAIVF